MQDQGKKLLMGVAIFLAAMMIWQFFFPQKKPTDADTAGSGSGSGSAVSKPTVQTSRAISQVGMIEGASPPAAVRGAEQKITLTYPNFTATFSSFGGVLSAWHLSDPRYNRDESKGELLPDHERFPEAGALAVNFNRGSTYVIPATAEWACKQTGETQVTCTYTSSQLTVDKVFDIFPGEYAVRLTVTVHAAGASTEQLAVSTFGYQDPATDSDVQARIQPRVFRSVSKAEGSDAKATNIAKLISSGPRYADKVQWTGFEHPYLFVAFGAKAGQGDTQKNTFASASGLMRTDLLFAPRQLTGDKDTATYVVDAYLGPKSHDELEAADKQLGTTFGSALDLGWFGFIAKPLLKLLQIFESTTGNWGIAIIMLTLLVKLLTLPLITKSTRNAKMMAALSPKVKALQKKYEGDRARFQTESMALYGQYHVKPLAGCLPAFLQMPIWIALYRMLGMAGELYQQPFVHGWIDDLTTTDHYHILLVTLVVASFFQMRLTPMNPDPSQRTQQRIMQFSMPAMYGWMAYSFPSGLGLYMLTNTLLSIVHTTYMNKFDKPSLEFAARIKAESDAEATGVPVKKDDKKAEAKDDDADDADDDKPTASSAAARNPRPAQARPKRRKKARR